MTPVVENSVTLVLFERLDKQRMRETSQTPQIDTPSNKDTLLLKVTKVDTKPFLKINGEESVVLSPGFINTLDFDSSDDNAGRERE